MSDGDFLKSRVDSINNLKEKYGTDLEPEDLPDLAYFNSAGSAQVFDYSEKIIGVLAMGAEIQALIKQPNLNQKIVDLTDFLLEPQNKAVLSRLMYLWGITDTEAPSDDEYFDLINNEEFLEILKGNITKALRFLFRAENLGLVVLLIINNIPELNLREKISLFIKVITQSLGKKIFFDKDKLDGYNTKDNYGIIDEDLNIHLSLPGIYNTLEYIHEVSSSILFLDSTRSLKEFKNSEDVDPVRIIDLIAKNNSFFKILFPNFDVDIQSLRGYIPELKHG